MTDARAAAMRKCTGNGCKVVGTIRRGCAAMAVDVKHPCGSFGWAIDSHLGRAENLSLRRCYEFGGKECARSPVGLSLTEAEASLCRPTRLGS